MIAEIIKTKVGQVTKYTRENWKEWFVIEVAEGAMITRGYLPVRRIPWKHYSEFWIFPLAPFVLVFFIIKNTLWSIWIDLIEWLRLLESNLDAKRDKLGGKES